MTKSNKHQHKSTYSNLSTSITFLTKLFPFQLLSSNTIDKMCEIQHRWTWLAESKSKITTDGSNQKACRLLADHCI